MAIFKNSIPEFYLRPMTAENLRAHIAQAKIEHRKEKRRRSFCEKLRVVEQMRDAVRIIRSSKPILSRT